MWAVAERHDDVTALRTTPFQPTMYVFVGVPDIIEVAMQYFLLAAVWVGMVVVGIMSPGANLLRQVIPFVIYGSFICAIVTSFFCVERKRILAVSYGAVGLGLTTMVLFGLLDAKYFSVALTEFAFKANQLTKPHDLYVYGLQILCPAALIQLVSATGALMSRWFVS
jgi:hypothetical protein